MQVRKLSIIVGAVGALIACEPSATRDLPGPPASATTPSTTASSSAGPAAATPPPPPPSAAPIASGATDDEDDDDCLSAARAREVGSVTAAEPPFADCAKSLKVHCPETEGERGGLYGLALDVARTTEARKQRPDACCYNSCD